MTEGRKIYYKPQNTEYEKCNTKIIFQYTGKKKTGGEGPGGKEWEDSKMPETWVGAGSWAWVGLRLWTILETIDERELDSHILPRTLDGDNCLKRGILSGAEVLVLGVENGQACTSPAPRLLQIQKGEPGKFLRFSKIRKQQVF